MAKAGRGDAQYMLRLPGGLRDRIKAYSESRGTSMNSEIVRILEAEFPEQSSLDETLQDLGNMLAVLTAGQGDSRLEAFADKVEETVVGILTGRVTGVDLNVREAVKGMWETYLERAAKDGGRHGNDIYAGRTEEEIRAHEMTGRFEKFATPPPDFDRAKDARRAADRISQVLPAYALTQIAELIEDGNLEGASDLIRSIPRDAVTLAADGSQKFVASIIDKGE